MCSLAFGLIVCMRGVHLKKKTEINQPGWVWDGVLPAVSS